VVTAVEILAMDLEMRETIRMETTERGDPDHHGVIGVDQDVILSAVRTKNITREMIVGKAPIVGKEPIVGITDEGVNDKGVNVVMTDRTSSEMGMTETVHPGDNDHEDSDLVFQGRIVHPRKEVKAKVAINTMMAVT
jgi:hypothetical protein